MEKFKTQTNKNKEKTVKRQVRRKERIKSSPKNEIPRKKESK